MPPRPDDLLQQLFLSLYSADELRRLIWRLPDGDKLSAELPEGGTSLATLAVGAVRTLIKSGKVNADLFDAMRTDRGGRSTEINRVERAFIDQAAAQPPPGSPQPPPPTQPATGRWPIFLAYARADLADAKQLGALLRAEVDTFLALDSIELGEDWDRAIPKAQRAAQISVVLSSKSTDRAYYQREEIAAAIDLARKDDTAHRVIPVWLDGFPDEDVPYGLRHKHGLDVVESGGLPGVAERILQLARKMGLTRANTALVRRLRKLGWDDHDALNAALNQGFPDDAAARPLLDALKAQGVSAPLRADPATRWLTLLAAAETRAPEGTTAVAKAAFLLQPEWTGGQTFLEA